jgi:hypothetical protein
MNTTTEKQTAVEWLIEQIENQRETGNTDLRTTLHFCDKAKEMEKEQIENAYIQGFAECDSTGIMDVEQYYNQTFNK